MRITPRKEESEMTRSSLILTVTVSLSLIPSSLALAACPSGMVESGSTCIDQYEASIWTDLKPQCVNLIKHGANLPPSCFVFPAKEIAIDGAAIPCDLNGGGCKTIFALSLFNVIPANQVNYFIAAAACRNSGKRLPTNAEWRAAALGTPDPDKNSPCNLDSPTIAKTGSHPLCISDVRALDMVGNAIEFVADWGPLATTGTNWDVVSPPGGFVGHGDVSNMGGAPTPPTDPSFKHYGLPGATIRGGSFNQAPGGSGGFGNLAGVYAIDQNGSPDSRGDLTSGKSSTGFRCAK
jgi:hypothetical protein